MTLWVGIWFDIIFSDAFCHLDQESLIRDLNSWLKIADELDSPQLIPQENFVENVVNFKTSIHIITEKISKHQSELIAKAEVDRALLTQYGISCSDFFNQANSTPNFPINLFNLISTNGSCASNTRQTIDITPYSKEQIALGITSNRVEDEASHFRGFIADSIQGKVLQALVENKTTDIRVYDDAERYLKDLISLSENIQNPILFIDDNELDSALSEIRYNPTVASKYGISFADGYSHYYLCHIGKIEVYSVYLSNEEFSILTTKNLFESVEFTKISDAQFVDVNYVASEDNENIGKLSFDYWIDITLKEDQPCIKTELKIKKED